jgi:hypothetical protein
MATVVNTSSQQYFGFDPRTIPECILWVDAADPAGNGVVPANGSSVTTWVDKARTPNNMTATGTVTYQGSPPRLVMSSSSMSATLSYGTNTLFIVYNQTGTSGPVFTTNNLDVTGLFPNETGTTFFARSDSAWIGPPFPTSTLPRNTINLISVQYAGTASGSAMNIWLSGVLNLSSTTSGTITRNRLTLAVRSLNNQFMAGNYHEVILYNTSLTTNERQQVEGYLAWKWGLQVNLPLGHPFKYNPPTMRVFRPIDIDTCRLWLDAADASTVQLSGSNVTTWLDKSGSGLNFSQATTARQPTYSVGTLNGQNGILFTGAGTNGAATLSLSNAAFTLTQGAYSIFVVARQNASAPSYTGYNYILKGSLTDGFLFFGNHSSKNFATFTSPSSTTWNDTNSNSPPVSTSNNPLLLGMTVSNTVLTPYYSGIAQNTKTGTTGAFTGMVLGDAPFPTFSGQNWNGVICEICIFNSTLTTSQRQQIEGYLTDKWRVAALPTTHPYSLQRALPSTPIFSPTAAPGLQVWLDSADPTALTLSGSNVTQWRDKSGNNRHGTPPATSNQPTYNGNGVLFSAGGVQYLPLANVSGMLTNTAFNIFVVERNEGTYTATVTEGFFLGAETIVEGGALAIGYRATSTLRFSTFGAGNDLDVTGLPTSTTTRLWSFNMPQTSNRNINLNGTLVATHGNTTKLNSSANLSVGRAFNGNYYRGRIYEILIYTTELSQFNRQRVEAYLAWKWGLQTLLPVFASAALPSIDSLVLWIDAAQDTNANGTFINTIPNRSTSGYSINAVTTNTIQIVKPGQNGRGHYTFGRATVSNFVWRTKFTVFFVSQHSTGSFLYSQHNGSSYRNYVFSGNWDLLTINTSFALQDGPIGQGTSVTGTTWNIFTIGYSNGTIATPYSINGVPRSTRAIRGSPEIDQNITANLWINGNHQSTIGTLALGELLHYNDNLSDQQCREIEGHLAAKWGIQLPPSHPFSKFRP